MKTFEHTFAASIFFTASWDASNALTKAQIISKKSLLFMFGSSPKYYTKDKIGKFDIRKRNKIMSQ